MKASPYLSIDAAATQNTNLAKTTKDATAALSNVNASNVAQKLEPIGKTAKLNAFQVQQLGYQLNDFFVQVASGGGVITPLIQQGSQLAGTFGGIGAAIAAVGALLTPVAGCWRPRSLRQIARFGAGREPTSR